MILTKNWDNFLQTLRFMLCPTPRKNSAVAIPLAGKTDKELGLI